MINDSHQFSSASKNSVLANGDGVDDKIESGRTVQTPQLWVSLAVVAATDELETAVTPWKCDNESGPRH